ncbi:(Fe-S)-binding protein [Paenibacillus filicis]|uniref:Glycolate oxidase iron-sulfur subunit n=1 Tax=Paenibacillus gyeongsangnamensis TaxID=3388067 RepID=A0ABT4QEV5_9BACL|nr:(Fe-S)-binding protein [Paenibacillus filicis]MCZ8515409.1 (Fe-S)-binding protein [Paenibacillus filicis]
MSHPPTSIKPKLAAAGGSPLAERMKLALDYDELTSCMRCGFCQPSCPTFKETGLEAASPRGRIALMKAVVDDLMVPDESFHKQMDLCLGCRACEPVCPADVKYGHLLEAARGAMEEQREHRWWVKLARHVTFKQLFPHPKRMRLVGAGLRFYQKSGLRRLALRSGALKLLPRELRQMEEILPEASSSGVAERLGSFIPAQGKPIAKVGMFRGCVMDVLFTDTNVNTVKLLSEAGFDVVIPETQTCCGALHAHAGELEQAKELARSNIAAFREADVDFVVSNAGGCGALLVEYGHLLRDDPEMGEAAARFSLKVKDISELLVVQGRLDSFKHLSAEDQPSVTVTYQDSCHLRNVMKAGNAPRDLLARMDRIRLVEMEGADRCCGSAGIYNLVQPDMSMDILDHKMEHVKETDARYVLTSNPGCLLQMKLGIEREGLSDRMQALHVADFLYERLSKGFSKR